MHTIYICKASPTGGEVTPDVKILITEELPRFSYQTPIETVGDQFDKQAQLLFNALTNSLPGGTLDRLLGKMLERKASHFHVLSWK